MNALMTSSSTRWILILGAAFLIEASNRLGGAGVSLMLAEMLILAILATSLNLLMSYGHMVSFGHAAYYGLGAYGFTLVVTKLGVPVPAALIFGPLVAGLGALVFGALCVRLSEIYFAMLTLACAQITFTILFQWYDFTGGDTGITGFMPARFGLSEANFSTLVMAVLAGVLAVTKLIVSSPLGLAIRSVGQDRARAEALGLAPRPVQLVAFVLAGMMAGIAGTLLAVSQGAAFPDYAGLGFTLDALIMVVLGGLHSFWGGVLGAILFTMLKHWAPLLTDHWGFVLGVLLLFIVIALPNGVAGLGERLGRTFGAGGAK